MGRQTVNQKNNQERDRSREGGEMGRRGRRGGGKRKKKKGKKTNDYQPESVSVRPKPRPGQRPSSGGPCYVTGARCGVLVEGAPLAGGDMAKGEEQGDSKSSQLDS